MRALDSALDRGHVFPASLKSIRARVLAFLLGGISALGFAPIFLLPASAIGFAGFAMLLASAGRKSALGLGWLFGFGQFVVGLNWITESFRFAGDGIALFAWPAIIGLSAFLALFPAAASLAARWVGSSRGGTILALPAAWTLMEAARGTLFTGFPWNLSAYVWGISDETMQAASVFGSYGLGLMTVTLFTAPLLLWRRDLPWTSSAAAIVVMATGAAMVWGLGSARLSYAVDDEVPDVQLRLVQGNIPQDQKWDPIASRGILDRYVALSRQAAMRQPTHVIWPETALPVQFGDEPELAKRLADAVPAGKLLFGAVRQAAGQPDGHPALLNSLLVLDGEGKLLGAYDKQRLVPFGEYMPFSQVLPLEKMTEGTIDFMPGRGPKTLDVPGLPRFRAMICYEAIFPTPDRSSNEAWILNVTNDAWFGTSSGPYQHVLAARFRAVERGVPLIRAANSGISAVVDPYGRVLASLGIGRTGVLDTALPAALPEGTFYSWWGEVPSAVVAALLIGLAAARRRADGRLHARHDAQNAVGHQFDNAQLSR